MPRVFRPQLQQILTLLVLFSLGKYSAHIHLGWVQVVGIMVFTGISESLLVWLRDRRLTYIPYAAFSTAVGVMLMLVAASTWMYVVVIVLALMQKHFMRMDHAHFFNPSNFALMVAMVLFYEQAHVVLGQLGDAPWLRWVVLVLAGLILVRVDRWIIPLSFVASYLAFEYFWVVQWDPVMVFEDVYIRFTAVSFVVFVAFMLTDPRTTPSRPAHQVFFGMVIALAAGGLDAWHGFRVLHLFMALFALSPWVPWVERPRYHHKYLLFVSLALFLLAIGAIIYLESQPPYYFEMEG